MTAYERRRKWSNNLDMVETFGRTQSQQSNKMPMATHVDEWESKRVQPLEVYDTAIFKMKSSPWCDLSSLKYVNLLCSPDRLTERKSKVLQVLPSGFAILSWGGWFLPMMVRCVWLNNKTAGMNVGCAYSTSDRPFATKKQRCIFSGYVPFAEHRELPRHCRTQGNL